MNELALTLPRLRRLRKPPARVVYLAIRLFAWCGYTLYWLLEMLGWWPGGFPNVVKAVFAAIGVFAITGWQRQLRACIRAWLAGERVAPVTRAEWRSAVFWLLWMVMVYFVAAVEG